jgi:HPt (histidine-containing phosphotransfer) domain-containing protein
MDAAAARRVIAANLTDELLTALDALFPEQSPGLDETLDSIRYRGGQRAVVRLLHSLHKNADLR